MCFLAALPRENNPFQDATRMIAEILCAEITNIMKTRTELSGVLESKIDEHIQLGCPLAETAREGCSGR